MKKQLYQASLVPEEVAVLPYQGIETKQSEQKCSAALLCSRKKLSVPGKSKKSNLSMEAKHQVSRHGWVRL